MDGDEPELGAELAIQREPRGPGTLLPSHRQRPPRLHLRQRGAGELAVRTDLLRQEL